MEELIQKKNLAINDAVYLARPRRVWLMGWSGSIGPTRSPLSNGVGMTDGLRALPVWC